MTPAENITPEPIIQTALGFMAAKHLFVANEIHLFEALEERACSLDELAARTNIPRRTLRIVADAMVALGFLDKQDGVYRNDAVASAFLSGRGPVDIRPWLRFWNNISYHKWAKLEESVRAGRGMAGRFEFADEQEEEIFSKGVESFSSGDARALPEAHDFSRYHSILDLGGGTGSFLLPLLARHASLTGTVFELPPVAAVARRVLASNPLGVRTRVVEGDFLTTPIPPGHDAVIIAHVIHTLSVAHNAQMLANLRKGVAPGARLLLVDLFTDPSHTEPTMAALMAGEFLMIAGEGDVYSEQEVGEWLLAAGWKMQECKALNGPTSLMVAEAV
jgi:2-polyprenyl-3-methyl-5-hydroxy-6-metoxy-1,4-benzoquinol methylase